jgi:hypothetical protein
MEKIENKGIINRVYSWFKNLTVKGLLGAILIAFVIIIILIYRLMNGLSKNIIHTL